MRKLNKAEAATAAALTLTGGGVAYAPNLLGWLTGNRLPQQAQETLHSEAAAVGFLIKQRYQADGYIPAENQPDPQVQGGRDIIITTTDGEKKFTIIASMLANSKGRLEPLTTYRVYVAEHYGLTDATHKEAAIAGSKGTGDGDWIGFDGTHTWSDQKDYAKYLDTNPSSGDPIEKARDIAATVGSQVDQALQYPTIIEEQLNQNQQNA